MGHAGNADLKLSLVDISRLAMVQRPVVSMWRIRHSTSATQFPDPVEVRNKQELFHADDIVEWLQETGLGNNPTVAEDVAAFASRARENFDLVTALLVVRALCGTQLADMHPEDVIDFADELDPDDECLFSEIESGASSLEPLLTYTDQLVDATFSASAAFEKLMEDRSRFERTDALFDPRVLGLVALAARSLTDGQASFSDATPGGSDLLLAIADSFDEATSVTLKTASPTPAPSRLAIRRLKVHAFSRENLHIGAPTVAFPGQIVVAHFPAANYSSMTDKQIMTAVDNIALELDGTQAAIVLAPARLLTDALEARTPARIRDTLLRSGKLRAAIRLPAGLLKSRPRQPLALWVLGKERINTPIADRWTTIADLSALTLDDSSSQDVVADLMASMQSRDTLKARAFRFTRLVRTSVLLAGDGNLCTIPLKPNVLQAQSSGHTELLVNAEAAIEALNSTSHGYLLDIQLDLGAAVAVSPATLGELLETKHLRLLAGSRLHAHDTTNSNGFTVIGLPELQNGTSTRHIDKLQLASQYPQAHLTEPGDVVFSTIGKPSAWVDRRGLSIVEFPARILRINHATRAGLIPSVLAADITSGQGGSWRRWHVKRFHEEHLKNTKTALEQIESSRQQALDRAARLEQLSNLLAQGSATAALRINSTTSTLEGNN
ncbi:hypothetical protein [Paeniglutamicibacter terrestris]|uniref:DNA methylase adenine-specific domain-containing protein n=1 Tax=Paeniglutamicibacter terrestris TaxID=2723403 RepID=A0ABX1G8U4_9MICC|nr:hypothetical protein [Paeniglutamicibacter terrestris]NKG22001.1 hypothetical protein [Paeniglutamicibacter terrestris]